MQINTFWLNFGGLSLTVTLKIRSRSPKPIQCVILPKCYIHENLVKYSPVCSWDIVHTSTFWLKFGSLSLAVTLKNRSRSPKSNQLFIMSQCYFHANLVPWLIWVFAGRTVTLLVLSCCDACYWFDMVRTGSPKGIKYYLFFFFFCQLSIKKRARPER